MSDFRVTAPGRLRSRFLYKALDAVLTAPLEPHRSIAAAIQAVMTGGQANYARLSTAAEAAGRLLPGGAARLSGALLRPGRLPLRYRRLSLLGRGSGATVFLLETERARWVLKVYRRSLARSPAEIAAIAAEFREKYRAVCSWYGGPAGIVPPATILMLHSPLLGVPAAAMLQPYLAGTKQDPFTDLTATALLHLLAKDVALRGQFLSFSRLTLQAYFEERRCLDVLGYQNVVIEHDPGGAGSRLWVIDNGIFDVTQLEEQAPPVAARLAARMARLSALHDQLTKEESCS